MSPVLSKQTGSSPSCRQALMAHSPLLPPPMMATFFAMLPGLCLGTASHSGAERTAVQMCKTLTLVRSQDGQHLKSLSGVAKQPAVPRQAWTWPVLGFALWRYLWMPRGEILPSVREHLSLSTQPSPGDGVAVLWGPTAPSQVGDNPPACPPPSPCPGEIAVVLPAVPAASRQLGGRPSPTCGRARQEQPGGGRRHTRSPRGSLPGRRGVGPDRGLASRCAASGSGASPSVTPPTAAARGSQSPAGSGPPARPFRPPEESAQALHGDTGTQPILVGACLVNKRCPGVSPQDYQDQPKPGYSGTWGDTRLSGCCSGSRHRITHIPCGPELAISVPTATAHCGASRVLGPGEPRCEKHHAAGVSLVRGWWHQ